MTARGMSAEERLGALSDERAELLRRLIGRGTKRSSDIPSLPRLSGPEGIQLAASWAQQRLWFVDQLEGGRAVYSVPVALRWRGALEETLLDRAIEALIRRHETLRTVFVNSAGRLQQRIVPNGSLNLPVVDLRGLDETERRQEVDRHKTEEVRAVFDLHAGPLIRGRLLRLQTRESLLLITLHHTICDGSSVVVLVRELVQLYGSLCEGADRPRTTPVLEPLRAQYADYAHWQQEQLRGAALDRQLAYWLSQLRGVPPQLELPTDWPRPAVQSYRGETCEVSLVPALTTRLKDLARNHNVTLFMVLYAGWSILLARLSGQDDVVVGTAVANRPRPELEGLIGLFVNTLALRVAVKSDCPVDRFLQRVKAVTLGAYAHQEVPFEKLVESLAPERSLSHHPIFQVMLALQETSEREYHLPGLSVTLEEGGQERATFDLFLSLQERDDSIVGTVNYAADLFERGTIERWLECWTLLLESMTADCRRCIGALAWLPETQRNRSVTTFNATHSEQPRERLIHALFESQVARDPETIAVETDAGRLSYTQLNQRANQLARYLRERGVGPDKRVALYLERGIEMVVGLLGTLKAGGAYVPLDPNYPPERLDAMLTDAEPVVVLTTADFVGDLSGYAGVVVAIDSDWERIATCAKDNLDPDSIGLDDSHLAYVIFTSGSTGKPKGVMIEHAAVVNFLGSMRAVPGMTATDRMLAVTTLSFDIAALEIYLPLVCGARLILAGRAAAADPNQLRGLLERFDVTVMQATPTTWQMLLSAGWAGRPALKALCGGEALTTELAVELGGKVRELWNLYGPTETTIWSCTQRISAGSLGRHAIVSIGRPIANTQIYILDESGQPVPVGVVGEIHIGGAGVARGYLNRAALTQERFIPDPFSGDAEARLYKTGDLGRWHSDGTIQYLGRNDHQVKLRGFRIELGEIEAQLARHPLVREAAVIVREETPGQKRLVAYTTARGPEAAGAEQLRAHLSGLLPEYMLPSAFVGLDSLPLTPNGKLDRRALPAPQQESYASRAYVAPQGQIEEILAGIWQELLHVQRIGRQDNFFELGGHSLLIVQMMERLRRVGLGVAVRRVFQTPTLADLALALSQETLETAPVPPNLIPAGCAAITPQMLPLVSLEPAHIEHIVRAVPGGAANIQDIYPLAPLQEGILFHHLLDRERGDIYVRPMVLSFTSREELDALITALQAVIGRHDVLRTAVLWEELPLPVQVVYRHATLPVQDLVLSADREPIAQLEHLIAGRQRRLDLRRAPLLQLEIAADPRGSQWYAILQTHHLVCDNESLNTLLDEALAHLEGRAAVLAAPQPYRNHVAQAVAHIRNDDTEAFFREKLSDIEEPTAPFGLMDVHAEGAGLIETRRALPPELARSIRVAARRLGVSTATVFHAAWALVVAQTSARCEVVFGSVLLGRLQGSGGSGPALGMFINTLPLRLRLGGLTARGLIEHVHQELIELLGHEQASLAVAQRCSGIVGTAPLFSSLLNYLHTAVDLESGFARTPGVRLLRSYGGTNYPIALSVGDQGEGFLLELETQRRVDPHRMLDFICTALRALTEALEREPDRKIARLSILSEAEREQILSAFNVTVAEFPREALIHELFERQVLHAPDAIAVCFEDQQLAYAELNGHANRLAHYLVRQGVMVGEYVPVYMSRSLEMLIAEIAVLKAGGVYVPIDPQLPLERRAFMIRDCAARRILCRGGTAGDLAERHLSLEWIDCIALSQVILRMPAENLRLPAAPTPPAYVMYTSGSTGMPKGVVVPHKAVNRLVINCGYAQIGPTDCLAHCSNPTFDASTFEIWGALLNGARLVIVAQPVVLDAERFSTVLLRERVTILWITVGLFAQYVDALAQALGELRYLITGGDVVEPGLLRRVLRNRSPRHLLNAYGPTECTTFSTTYEVGAIDVEAPGLPIGRPIANARVYILDAQREPAPIGVPGEIYIGGEGVALGYLNRPELTAERFIADSFSADPEARLYRTGDLGRWRSDGAIEFLGRNDHQVKLRGFRIELGEIEAQLARHPLVREAAVIVREETPGQKRLVAYTTARGPEAAGAEQLRAHLSGLLPEYMLPSAFVGLDSLPLTPNGKLDRRALPAPQQESYASRAYVAPQGQIEEILAGIWQELLHVQRIGRQDNFFELGGHSLLIVQMMERLRRVGLGVAVRRVFQTPTLADLALALSQETLETAPVPPNLIPAGCEAITPQMLPLVSLEPAHIEHIVRAVPGGAANIQDIYPLAPLQEGILFHHLLDRERGDTYVVSTLLRASSRERLEAFISALQAVIERHDILRTAILWEQLPQPAQVVYRRARLPVEEIALQPHRSALEQLQERMQSDRQQFDLRRAPLIRLQIAPDVEGVSWHAILQLHHVACDHETMAAIVTEVVAHLEGHAAQLPPSVPYRVHVAQALAYAKTHDSERFFREKLQGIEESTAPFGLHDVHANGGEVEEASLEVGIDLARRIRERARRMGVSAATLFHAAWALVVAHTSAREDVVFGSVLLGRLQGSAGAERIMGLFINTLPLRLRLANLTARELIQRVQRELVELLSHEQASLAVAQRCSDIAGSAPLFTTLLNYRHSGPETESAWSSARGVEVRLGRERTNYPIVMAVDDLSEGFVLTAQTDRRVNPQRLSAYFLTALHSLAQALEEGPDRTVLSLSVLPEGERQLILEQFNATSDARPPQNLLDELFQEQVRRRPNTPAVVYEGERLTYAELDCRAERLARSLVSAGVEPDQLVGLCTGRGLDMYVGILGIWRAGGAYVPLDPDYPSERLTHMLEDAAPAVVVTHSAARQSLPETRARILMLDSTEAGVRGEEPALRPLAVRGRHPGQLAYLIYTSGSTGRPKGVMVKHENVVNHWRALEALYRQPTDCRRVAVNAPFTFDASVQQIVQLLSGCTLFPIPRSVRVDPPLVLDFIEHNRVDGIDCTPSQLSGWVAAGLLERTATPLRTVLVGGEAIDATLWTRLASSTEIVFYNVYGPTECTVDSTAALLREPAQGPHIGRPLAHTRAYILDSRRQPVPLGVAGELYIGGAGVARGYLNRPELTGERFLPDPFVTAQADGPEAHMYRTGDLGCWMEDGRIQYLGRNDHQVKVRGFRIELGEIEAQLARHPGLEEAVVLAREDVPGEKRLVAYLTARAPCGETPPATPEDLRSHLRAVLPDYMVPSAFVILPELPRTSNGKLDRRALPAPGLGAYVRREYVPPQGELEEMLGGLWCRILRLERVGREDDFFEIGGHSLHGVKLMSALAERLEVSLPLNVIFKCPTIKELAQQILQESRGPSSARLQELETPGTARAPFSHSQLAYWNRLRLGERASLRHIATVMHLHGPLRVDALQASLQEVINRHDALRIRIGLVDGVPYQEVAPVALAELEVVQPSPGMGSNATWLAQCVEHFIVDPFDVTAGPLFVCRLVRCAQTHHVLMLAMDHLISDAFSMGLLLRDLFGAYADRQQRGRLPAPPVQLQFPAFARRQQSTRETWLKQHQPYWDGRLQGYRPLRFPTDLEADPVGSTGWGTVPVTFDAQLRSRLNLWSRQNRTTLVTAVFTAYAALVLRWCDTQDAILQFETDGRDDPGVRQSIGFFAAPLYLRLRLADSDSFLDLLQQVKSEYCSASEHVDFCLLEARAPTPDFASSPAFNWIPGPGDESFQDLMTTVGLTAEPIACDTLLLERFASDADPVVLLRETGEQIVGGIHFARRRQSVVRMQWLAANFMKFIHILLAQPHTRVSEIAIHNI